ncbi:hypothetical protein [Vitreimonas flagellata]|uniref:hypothetical protein n=1 Tax=Vitreimonas flagellata TaxID=2560861 RepID=UPI001074D213|nr:hypothetical protein [Vitreimonas flagellata]
MIDIAWIVSALALAIGVYLGGRGLIDPKWASRLVRLQADDQGGGFAEFRATFGGVFLGLHLVGLGFVVFYLWQGVPMIGVAAIGAVAVLSAGWGGAALGRLIAIWRDGADTPFNRFSVLFEVLLAAAIGAPWVVWVLS